MVAPGFLANPEVRRWLNGVEPAWTMLEFDSFNALHDEPSASNHAIRLEANLSHTEISGSSVTANTLLLLRRAAKAGGLKLTATGNLSRAVVDEMFEIIQTPDYDKAELPRFQKVINEPDFLPLHFVRILTQAAKLFRTYRGKLVLTPLGRRMLALEQHDGPQAFGEFIIRPHFVGTQHFSNCVGQSVAALGNLNAAASRLGFYSVQGLQNAIHTFCGG
jgi:hypothetical protein